ncbi:MAG: peptidoglycan D,D-transpeptidase FtsI family protein [Candidatus Saccharimonadaceae bacterium]
MKPELLHGSRSRILAGIVLAIAAVFVFRLFYLQVIQHEHYVSLAQVEQVKKERLPATRGEIYALNGNSPVKVVLNETVYTVFVDPVVILESKEVDAVKKVMREVAGGNLRDDFDNLVVKQDSRYQVIATRVTRTQAEKIKEKKLSGIGFQAISQRVYPEGQLASQVLGFVNAEGTGNYGLEGYMNDELKGVDGRLETVTDVSDVPLTIGDRNIREPAKDGKNIVMTIDRNVQSKVEQALADGIARSKGTDASAVVMDPTTGRVLAMANLPTYNPAEYYKVTDGALFNNGTVSAPYEPGSDVKTYTMATAIDKNVATPSDTYNNTDSIKIDDRTISNATKGHTGVISFQTALTWSLNTGFVTLAQRLGDGKEITKTARDTMYDYFHNRLGLGELTGIELANEQKGIVISPDEADGNAVRYSNMAFGQGLDATIIQVTGGFSAIINGGSYYKPTVINGYVDEDGVYKQNPTPQPTKLGVVKPTTSQQIKEMTHIARTSFRNIDKPGYYIGGKTGTSQVIRNGEYADDETIATYLGYGGSDIDHPQYVIMVSIHGDHRIVGGSTDAMPIFTDISNWMLDYLKIQPKG